MHIYLRNARNILACQLYTMTKVAISKQNNVTIVTFYTILESKILDAGNLLILSNLQKLWTIACKDVSRVFEIEYSTYHILNRLELCECSLTAGNYLLSYTNINWKCTRSKRRLLHYILFLQQDSTGYHHQKIQQPGR